MVHFQGISFKKAQFFFIVLLVLGIIALFNIQNSQAHTVYKEQDSPLFMPIRDVTVIYAVQPENSPISRQTKTYFAGHGRFLRIDGPDNIGWTVINMDHQQVLLVMNKDKVFALLPYKGERNPFFLDSSMKFSPKGFDRIAGLPCKQWQVTAKSGQSTVCVTDDGVLLKQTGKDAEGQKGNLVALSVNYGEISATIFQAPAGYQQVSLPSEKMNSSSSNIAKDDSQFSKEGISTQENPFVTPQHDVDVVYAIAGPMPGLPPFHQRMRWSVQQWKQRIDSQGVDTYMVTDYRIKQLVVVNQELKKKTTMTAPGETITQPGMHPAGNYVKVGEASIAGEACTEWHTTDNDGNPSDVCYTKDGVLLRVVRNNIPLVVALRVVRGTQPAAIFTIPSGLKELAPTGP